MKGSVSDPLKTILRLLKIDESFPLFFYKPRPSQVTGLIDRITKLNDEDHSILLGLLGKELNIRLHQMSIMSRIDYKSIFLSQAQMKEFMEQGGSLNILLEIQHNLGLGVGPKVWTEMTDEEIETRARNTIFAIHGMGTTQLKPQGLWKVQQQWFGSYTMEFALNHREFSDLYNKRFARLVELSAKKMLTPLNEWIDVKDISDLRGCIPQTLSMGHVMVGLGSGISFADLWKGTFYIEKELSRLQEDPIPKAEILPWPLNLPSDLDSQFERFYNHFKVFAKTLTKD
ncbi:uncharacterized protein MELLADRAFT_66054 [Melampsora larici-populina 98AG31]|uniref:Uncharacterized protein n=1 Tax=Melampsora larici-populina (strain 98AG31 / pathotype 3-4-7) TaxID=747676 RepID=F4RXQ2_MELLP|nr:uncharacterized protein MELLADRAFT_66054 [Melampsora larici-populina 98AG31]EGG02768.1 hypothetical protein MELLADRAFT_66054 [Melampsora larici-populina 98AG31]